MINLQTIKELKTLDLDYSDFTLSDGEDRNGLYHLDVRQYTFPYNDKEEAERDCSDLMGILEI